mmetsp:Transcript_18403/g.22527  ORF Transcript_18403/g.22527 Transcript_18403/m.22527 type:complete len:410 (-) Transcript_18403:45-1274(-)
MAPRKRKNTSNDVAAKSNVTISTKEETNDEKSAKLKQREKLDTHVSKAAIEAAKSAHFVPTLLVITILVCSGALAILSYRDLVGTGKIIFGPRDEAMLEFTASRKWFDASRGWKSKQGGFSAVEQMTTDDNNMGGFFVRKLAGATALSYHLQKLYPIIFQSANVHFGRGDYSPMLVTSVIGNFCIAGFYLSHFDDFKSSGAEEMGFAIVAALIIEAIIIAGFLLTLTLKKPTLKAKDCALPEGKGPKSIVSKIVCRTVLIVSGMISVIAGRDFFFPGQELPFPPYDDIYLEWTGAFIHSPPPQSAEAEEYGLEAPLYIGDLFISRLAALYLLVISFQKLVGGCLVRVGKDNSGIAKCRMFWQVQCISDALILFTLRVFASAAKSASLDLRWHIMSIGYEFFILLLCGWM